MNRLIADRRRWDDVLIDPVMQEEAGRGTTIVHTLGHEAVTAAYNETRRIATGALAGCTAVAVVLEYDGIRKAYMQHMPPTRNQEGLALLDRFLQGEPMEAVHSSRAVVMTPAVESCGVRAISQSYTDSRYGRMARGYLIDIASEHLGDASDVRMVEYSWTKGYSQVLAELLGTGESAISINGNHIF